jgi:diguanylate cyclase (GGDEF)-like protein
MPRSPRLLLLTLSLIVVALVAAGFVLGWRTLALETDDTRRLTTRLDVSTQALEAKFLAAEMNARQSAYAFEIRRGAAGAAEDNAKARAEFLRGGARLTAKLAELERAKLSAEQRVSLQTVRASFDQFVALDKRIVEAYRSATEERMREADALLQVDAPAATRTLTRHLDTLAFGASVSGGAASERADERERRMRRWLGLLAAASIALSAFLVYFIARTLAKRDVLAQQLDTLARTDALTGVANRRAWDEELPRALQRAKRTRLPLCVVMVDLDHFKKFNDTHGHPAGDRLLSDMSAAFRAELREDDQIARYGGEEFALLLNGCDATQARAMLQRLSKVMPLQQTFSAGIVQCDGSQDANAVVALADRALYQAKSTGRRRAVIADPAGLAAASASNAKVEPS